MPRRRLIHEDLTRSVIGAFYEVYNVLGFGSLEHIYIPALEHELRARGHRIAREVWVTVFFKGMVMGKQRLDMVVDEKLVVEVKSTYDLRSGRPSATSQLPVRDALTGRLVSAFWP